ncbi:MAG: hypothetical protein H6R10_407 [Rhodocyclaceae bacterium]|nr:hypothetical protein [Rhodocyclaceae bacterium]
MAQAVIVTPALADANNGNWRTAQRWARFLAPVCRTRLVKTWPDAEAAKDTVMIALHARRSAASIAAWSRCRGGGSLAVVLTGTDLYRDIHDDSSAQQSLALADTLVALQERGPAVLPPECRAKCRIIFQSVSGRRCLPKTGRHLRALMVGHLREEKSPETLFAAARLLRPEEGILIDHVGGALDAELAEAARAAMADCPHYRWLGSRPHEETRRRIQRAHILVHSSRMEGGAHAILEAAASGTPVLATRIDGNVGLLGDDYGGYFEWGDAAGLADLLRRCRASQNASASFLQSLGAQIGKRTPLFSTLSEQSAVRQLVADLGRAAAQKGVDCHEQEHRFFRDPVPPAG